MSDEIKPVSTVHAERIMDDVDRKGGDFTETISEKDVPPAQARSRFAKMFRNNGPKDGDLGAQWLEQYTGERPELTAKLNNQVKTRIDAWLLPVTCLIYLNQQLDKSSVAFAAVFGFREDAGMTNSSEYAWLTTIIYIAQLVFQPLSVYALVRFKVNRWILFCFIGWSSSCMILAAFTSFPGLLVFRFILGAFEASIAPTMMIIVSGWWTRREQPLRNNLWYSANGLAILLGSLIAYGVGHLEGKGTPLFVYQYIFLINGAIGMLSCVPVYLFLPSHITSANWLTDTQKYLALERIRLNNTGTQNTTFKRSQVIEALLDLKTWGFVVLVFCASVVSGGISAFGPLIIKGFGYDKYQTILFNTIPGVVGIAFKVIAAYAAQYFRKESPVIAGVLIFPVAAAAALWILPKTKDYASSNLAVYFILQGFQPLTPLVFTWTFANTAGHTKKTTTTGMLFIGLTVGNMVGPQLYLSREGPYYRTGLTANMVLLVIMFVFTGVQVVHLAYLNKRNAKRRLAAGKTGRHVDYSLVDSSKWAAMKSANKTEGEEGAQEEQGNTQAFEDLTDKQNDEFIYSY